MKLVIIAYNEALEGDVDSLLRVAAVDGHTKWTKVMGKGVASEPHLLTHIWPKANSVVMSCVEDDKAARLMDGVRKLRQELSHEGIKAFSLPVADVT